MHSRRTAKARLLPDFFLSVLLYNIEIKVPWRCADTAAYVFCSSFGQVVNPRAALLSNFEVLQVLREQEAERNAAREAALAIKREDPTAKPKLDEVSENLRTVEYEVSRAVLLRAHV